MLSLKHILKVGRLLDETGEPRPGFLHDETDNLEGQGSAVELGPIIPPAPLQREFTGEVKSVRVSLDYEEDPETGDVRIVQR